MADLFFVPHFSFCGDFFTLDQAMLQAYRWRNYALILIHPE